MPVEMLPTHPRIEALLEQGAANGCVNLADLSDLIEDLDLDKEEAQDVHDAFAERGIDVTDDCGQSGVEPTRYSNGELAGTTSDALQLFLSDMRRYPLLTKEEGMELARQLDLGDASADQGMIDSTLPVVVSVGRQVK